MIKSWKREIAVAWLVKQAMMESDEGVLRNGSKRMRRIDKANVFQISNNGRSRNI